jgi:hypothetical protein
MCRESIPASKIIIEVEFSDFDLLERLHVMADELDLSWSQLVNMLVHRLLDDIYVIRMLWGEKQVFLKESNIFYEGCYGVLGAEKID